MLEPTALDKQYRATINNIANDFMIAMLRNPSVPANNQGLALVAVQHAQEVMNLCEHLYHPDNHAKALSFAN